MNACYSTDFQIGGVGPLPFFGKIPPDYFPPVDCAEKNFLVITKAPGAYLCPDGTHVEISFSNDQTKVYIRCEVGELPE